MGRPRRDAPQDRLSMRRRGFMVPDVFIENHNMKQARTI
jgi:hypothetical protein